MFARLLKVSLQIWKVSYINQQNQMHIKLKEKTLCLLFSKENFSVWNVTKIARLKFAKFYQCTIVGNKAEGRISKTGNKKTKHVKFSEKRSFHTPDTHTYICVSGGKTFSFFGKFGLLCFLVASVLRFTLLPYYWRNVSSLMFNLFLRMNFIYIVCRYSFWWISSISKVFPVVNFRENLCPPKISTFLVGET